MKEGPNIALLGSLIGDPARANMLTCLMSGKAHTVSELASEAGITLQTASAHLSKLETAGLLVKRKQGRHRYFALAGEDVSHVLEVMMGFAADKGHVRLRTGPRDPALRKARVCYNHLAGELAVQVFDSLIKNNFLTQNKEKVILTERGVQKFESFGLDIQALEKPSRELCKPCLDWSARRSHLAGVLGVALLNRVYEQGWAKKESGSRVVHFTKQGEQHLLSMFDC